MITAPPATGGKIIKELGHFTLTIPPARRVRIQLTLTKLRDECLNEHFFFGLAEARQLIEAWRQDYNQLCPHSSLGALAPAEYANRQGGTPPVLVMMLV